MKLPKDLETRVKYLTLVDMAYGVARFLGLDSEDVLQAFMLSLVGHYMAQGKSPDDFSEDMRHIWAEVLQDDTSN